MSKQQKLFHISELVTLKLKRDLIFDPIQPAADGRQHQRCNTLNDVTDSWVRFCTGDDKSTLHPVRSSDHALYFMTMIQLCCALDENFPWLQELSNVADKSDDGIRTWVRENLISKHGEWFLIDLPKIYTGPRKDTKQDLGVCSILDYRLN